ncbi:MAG: helix-hairpin-helix domain-containing protein [Anaerolineales bacterium]
MKNRQLLTFLNDAKLNELIALPGIGPSLADQLINNRPFESLESVTIVKGISANILDKISAASLPASIQHPKDETVDGGSLVTRLSDISKKTLGGLSEFSDAVGKRGQAVRQAVEALPEKFERVPISQGSLWGSLLRNGITALIAVLVTLVVLGSINGSLKYSTGTQYLTMQREITQIATQLDSLEENMNGLRTRLNTLESLGERTAALEISQEQLTVDVKDTNEQVADMQAEVSNINEKISHYEERAQRFETFLLDLNTLLDNLFNPQGEY